MKDETPIAVFVYNRPDHTTRMLASLEACSRLGECQVHIYCDGAKKPEHVENVRAVREVAREVSSHLKGARMIEREENLGLARSIVSGVTELCEQYGRVIVLEDDLILHPFFLDFMLQSLDRYEDDDHVAQIVGFTFPINAPSKPDALFLPLTSSWGWATWKRAWDLFSWDLEEAVHALDTKPDTCYAFDLDGAYGYSGMLRLTAEGKLDTWDIQWYWRIFEAGKLALYPRRSLVWQNGFDESATHTTTAWSGLQKSLGDFLREQWRNPISFPDLVQADDSAFENLKNFLRREPSNSLLARLKGMLKYILTLLVKLK